MSKEKKGEGNNVVQKLQATNRDLQCVAGKLNGLMDQLGERGSVAVYKTQIQFGGPEGDWHDDEDLLIAIVNRNLVVPAIGVPENGTTVTWNGPNGNGSITFFNDSDSFRGMAQFPNEGPVGYRGKRYVVASKETK